MDVRLMMAIVMVEIVMVEIIQIPSKSGSISATHLTLWMESLNSMNSNLATKNSALLTSEPIQILHAQDTQLKKCSRVTTQLEKELQTHKRLLPSFLKSSRLLEKQLSLEPSWMDVLRKVMVAKMTVEKMTPNQTPLKNIAPRSTPKV
jgi:hypothetical protein